MCWAKPIAFEFDLKYFILNLRPTVLIFAKTESSLKLIELGFR